MSVSSYSLKFRDYTARSASINCLEIVKVRNFGYVNIQSTKVLSIVVRNRYEQVVMLATKLSGSEHDAFKASYLSVLDL